MNRVRSTFPLRSAAPGAIILWFLVAAPAIAQDATSDVLAVLERWAASYSAEAATPERMLELYDPETVFWGTGAREPFVGAEEIGRYFRQQFGNFPLRRVSFIDPIVRVYGDTATATGLYRFDVRTASGDVNVTHRFSFALHRTAEGWIIVHQHSSQLPPER